jgi:hypothetical protein
METRRILIAGDTLFAEMLARLLANNPAVEVIGVVPGLDACQQYLAQNRPDALIYTGKVNEDQDSLAWFLSISPDLPVLCADLSANVVKVIISQNIQVHSSNDLLAAIAALPKRS